MNRAAIKAGFDGFIGWRQNDDPNGLQLTTLTTSTSGMYYNDIHPVLTIDNLASIAPDYKKLFPGDASAQNTAFDTWLKTKTENGIIEAVNDWNSEKNVMGTGVNLLHSKRLFDNASSVSQTTDTLSKVVGIELRPKKSKSLLIKVNKIGLHFELDQDSIEIKVFQSGKGSPIYEEAINYDTLGKGGVVWTNVNWELKSNENYYIVYDSSDLDVIPVNGVYDYSAIDKGLFSFPCGKYFKSTAFDTGGNGIGSLWDPKDNNYTLSTNYGINLDITVECDLSDFVIEQKDIFLESVRLKVGMNMMREIATNGNARENRNKNIIDKRQILNEIDGDTQGDNSMSIFGRYRSALKKIAFDDSNIDSVCLPCRKRGIEYGSIGPGGGYQM